MNDNLKLQHQNKPINEHSLNITSNDNKYSLLYLISVTVYKQQND